MTKKSFSHFLGHVDIMDNKTLVGLIGCGNIGRILAEHQKSFTITYVYDTDPEKLRSFSEAYGIHACSTFAEFLLLESDIIVEAASVSAAEAYLPDIIRAGNNVLIMSTGALADEHFRSSISTLAREKGTQIHLPSGAVMGLDNIRISAISPVNVVKLKTTKPPRSLGLPKSTLKCVFSGKASDCIRLYPKNSNVSVSLSLAAQRDIDVELWADPLAEQITHEIFFSGAFGDAYIRVVNRPSPGNPATSYLAALSALAVLENLNNPLKIGI